MKTSKSIIANIIFLGFLMGWLVTGVAAETTTATKEAAPVAMKPTPLQSAAMGDWQTAGDSDKPRVAQVIAYEDGKFAMHLLEAFHKHDAPLALLQGREEGGKIFFEGGGYTAIINGQNLHIEKKGTDSENFELRKTARVSPTLGQAPPEGAVVLFDGTSLDRWQRSNGEPAGWKLAEGGAMEVAPKTGDIETKRGFTNARYHIEFRSPFMPAARGQQRGNSGVYVQGSYEIQVLDSYGFGPKDNECGGVYKVGAPRVSMCAPPLQWQTYDITFHAARFDESGKKTRNARLSVDHNGINIHKNLEIPGLTGGARYKTEPKEPAVLMLQNHGGDPVQYRNIWVVEIPEDGKTEDGANPSTQHSERMKEK